MSVFGGRIVAAVGCSGAEVDQELIGLAFADKKHRVKLVEKGRVMETPEDVLIDIMGSEEIIISVDLSLGGRSATAWGCDLTYDYVRINAQYTT